MRIALEDTAPRGLRDAIGLLGDIVTPEQVDDVDVVVCSSTAAEDADTAWLKDFVEGGGAALVLCDALAGPGVGVGRGLLDVAQAEGFVRVPDPGSGHVLTAQVESTTVADHPCTKGVSTVRVHRARPLVGAEPRATPLVRHDDEVLALAARPGAGRLVVVADPDLFAPHRLGEADNAAFLAGVLHWLAGLEESRTTYAAAQLLLDMPVGGAEAERGDLASYPAGAVIDASPYRESLSGLVERLGAGEGSGEDAALVFHELPRELRRPVSEFAAAANDDGVLLIRGLPTHPDVPPTPTSVAGGSTVGNPVSEFWLAVFASAVGFPIGYLQEQGGSLIQHVVPTPSAEDKISSESSAVSLGFHTEMGFHPYSPDHLLLSCIRSDHDAAARTVVASARHLASRLSTRSLALLFEPMYRPGIDFSFGSPNGTSGNGPVVPVFYGDPADPYLNFDQDLAVALNDEAQAALDELREVSANVARWVVLRPGDLLIIDNRRAAHARSQFRARYDGNDRWLQRMCVVRDPVPSASHRRSASRVIDAVFAF